MTGAERLRVRELIDEHQRLLLADVLGLNRVKRLFEACVYCAEPCVGRACPGHRDLLALDPNYGGAA